MAKFKFDFQDQQQEIDITRQGAAFHVEWNGQSIECHLRYLQESYFILELIRPDGTRHTIHAAGSASGDIRQLWVDGQVADYKRVRLRGTAQNDSALAATIPAVVTQVLAAVGDVVAVGDKLILLESMKMIIPIQAPYDGVVEAVHCVEGESVQAGIQLIEVRKKEEE